MKLVSADTCLLFLHRCRAAILFLLFITTVAGSGGYALASDNCISDGVLRLDYDKFQSLSPNEAEDSLSDQFNCARALDPFPTGRRVLGGDVANSENFADVVLIEFDNGDRCTGVLVALDTILTAGHCSCGSNYSIKLQFRAPTETTEPTFAQLIITDGPVRFPGYRCSLPPDVQPGRDLAYFRIEPWTLLAPSVGIFEVPVKPTAEVGVQGKASRKLALSVIRPAILVLRNPELRSLYLVGFGRTETGKLATEMRAAFVGILSRFCASGRAYGSYCAMHREFALAKSRILREGPITDSCGGDSGAPVYRLDSATEFGVDGQFLAPSKRTLVGIVSRALLGVAHEYPGFCGGGGIYTSVGTKPVLDWLSVEGIAYQFDESPDVHVE